MQLATSGNILNFGWHFASVWKLRNFQLRLEFIVTVFKPASKKILENHWYDWIPSSFESLGLEKSNNLMENHIQKIEIFYAF